MLAILIHLHGNWRCPFKSCAKRLHTMLSISILLFLKHRINCAKPALPLNGCHHVNSKTFASICLPTVLYYSIWSGNSEWIWVFILYVQLYALPLGILGGNGQIHLFFHKCFHFETSWGSRRQFLCSSILKQAGRCYLINAGAWIHQWITSRAPRPSSVSAHHIFWHAISCS